jgi:predicted permease
VGLVLKAAAGRTSTAGRARFGLRRMLVALQVALSFVLLFGALLFVRSLRNLVTTDPGFRDSGVMIVRVDTRPLSLEPEGLPSFTRGLLDRVRGTPGVSDAAISDLVPISGNGWSGLVRLPGSEQGPTVRTLFNAIGPRFLGTIGIELIAGRDIGEGDRAGAPRVAIVNQQLARRLGAAGRIGGRFLAATSAKDDHPYEIIGIVRDSKYGSLREQFQPTAFLALAQKSDQGPRIALLVHGAVPARTLASAVKGTVADYAPAAILELDTLDRLLHQSTLIERLMATLAGFFGLLAALLAAVGLYGVISYGVVSRARELGIRMALGAGAARVTRMIVREALELLAIGLGAGVALGLVAARATGALLYGLEPRDPLCMILTAALLAIIALAASLLPARRAARADPMLTLRDE